MPLFACKNSLYDCANETMHGSASADYPHPQPELLNTSVIVPCCCTQFSYTMCHRTVLINFTVFLHRSSDAVYWKGGELNRELFCSIHCLCCSLDVNLLTAATVPSLTVWGATYSKVLWKMRLLRLPMEPRWNIFVRFLTKPLPISTSKAIFYESTGNKKSPNSTNNAIFGQMDNKSSYPNLAGFQLFGKIWLWLEPYFAD